MKQIVRSSRYGDGGNAQERSELRRLWLSALFWSNIVAAYFFWEDLKLSAGLIVKLVAESGVNRKSTRALHRPSATCWPGPLGRTHIKETNFSADPMMSRAMPIITLYGPCPVKSFVSMAREYASAVLEWRFIQSETGTRMVVQHYAQEALIWGKGYEQETLTYGDLPHVILPAVGLHVHGLMYGDLAIKGQGLVTFLAGPTSDGSEFDVDYLPMLRNVNAYIGGRYVMTYMLPGMPTLSQETYADCVASLFGVTDFPSIVVHRKYPEQQVVYHGDMSADSVKLFLDDVSLGCADYEPQSKANLFAKSSRPMCDATPILGTA